MNTKTQNPRLMRMYEIANAVPAGEPVNPKIMQTWKAQSGAKTWRTFKQWKDEGKRVKKGEKGWPVFSRPLSEIKKERGEEVQKRDNGKYRIAYLFNENQVQDV